MKTALKWPVLAMLLCAPLTAEAHRVWMLPSATVLSGDDVWITVDAAVSNDLFYFEHFPLQIANLGSTTAAPQGVRGRAGQLSVTAPDGSTIPHQNGSTGRYRSTFDVHLTQKALTRLPFSTAASSPPTKRAVRPSGGAGRLKTTLRRSRPTPKTCAQPIPRPGWRFSSPPASRRQILSS
jgi:hypothetical protein